MEIKETVGPLLLTYVEKIDLADYVPEDDRAAWLESHPTVAAAILAGGDSRVRSVVWRARPTAWERAGYPIDVTGQIGQPCQYDRWQVDLAPMVRCAIEADQIPDAYGPEEIEPFIGWAILAEGARLAALSPEGWGDSAIGQKMRYGGGDVSRWEVLLAGCPALRERVASERRNLADAEAREEAEVAARKAEDERLAAEAKARDRALAEAQEAQIAAALSRLGTPEQIGRWAEGYMSEDEGRRVVAQEVFAPFEEFARYKKIEAADYCREPDLDESEGHDRRVRDPEVIERPALTDAQFSCLARLRAARPGAKVEIRRHSGVCQHPECPPAYVRLGAMITVTIDGVEYSKEFSLE